MLAKQIMATFALLAGSVAAAAQQTSQVQLKIEPTNRTLTVSAEDQVSVDSDLAILHVGFQTPPTDAKGSLRRRSTDLERNCLGAETGGDSGDAQSTANGSAWTVPTESRTNLRCRSSGR